MVGTGEPPETDGMPRLRFGPAFSIAAATLALSAAPASADTPLDPRPQAVAAAGLGWEAAMLGGAAVGVLVVGTLGVAAIGGCGRFRYRG